MQIEDRLPEAAVGLNWIHREFKNGDPQRQFLSDVQFAFQVCQSNVSLPEEKVDAAPLHAAGRNLETWEAGWRNGTPIVLVMPQVEEVDMAFQVVLADQAGQVMKDELGRCGIPFDQVFVTHAIRFLKPPEVRAFRQGHRRTHDHRSVERHITCCEQVRCV
jgi:hypothetical protein